MVQYRQKTEKGEKAGKLIVALDIDTKDICVSRSDMNKSINEYPANIQNIVKELKNSFSIGEFYSARFYEASNEKIAEVLSKNSFSKCSCWKCQGLTKDTYGE